MDWQFSYLSMLTKATSSPFRYGREKRTSSTRASRFNAAGDFRARTLVRCPHRSTQRQNFSNSNYPWTKERDRSQSNADPRIGIILLINNAGFGGCVKTKGPEFDYRIWYVLSPFPVEFNRFEPFNWEDFMHIYCRFWRIRLHEGSEIRSLGFLKSKKKPIATCCRVWRI